MSTASPNSIWKFWKTSGMNPPSSIVMGDGNGRGGVGLS
jgi:hypothetical protein